MRWLIRLLTHRRPRVAPLPNPPWSVRDQQAAIARAREDWFR